jgi:hypothetical protein
MDIIRISVPLPRTLFLSMSFARTKDSLMSFYNLIFFLQTPIVLSLKQFLLLILSATPNDHPFFIEQLLAP